jgi:hypothetical protein
MFGMQHLWIEALNSRRPKIRRRWEALLNLESVETPLAHPTNLAHLIDWTLDEVLAELRRGKASRRIEGISPDLAGLRTGCQCGRNPLLNLFIAGEQALLESLVELQASLPANDPLRRSTSAAELYMAIQAIAARDFESFCSACVKRPHSGRPATIAKTTLPV